MNKFNASVWSKTNLPNKTNCQFLNFSVYYLHYYIKIYSAFQSKAHHIPADKKSNTYSVTSESPWP